MRALMGLVIGMGVLIVAGVAVLLVVLAGRMAPHHGPAPLSAALPSAAVVLDEPAGTRIAGIAPLGDTLALQLQGGGADRVVVVDPQGRVTRRLGLAR